MTKHQITHRLTGAILFECEVPDNVASRLRTRHALESRQYVQDIADHECRVAERKARKAAEAAK